MTEDATNEQHMKRLGAIIDSMARHIPLSPDETAAVRWARDQVVELRRERDEAVARADRAESTVRAVRDLHGLVMERWGKVDRDEAWHDLATLLEEP